MGSIKLRRLHHEWQWSLYETFRIRSIEYSSQMTCHEYDFFITLRLKYRLLMTFDAKFSHMLCNVVSVFVTSHVN